MPRKCIRCRPRWNLGGSGLGFRSGTDTAVLNIAQTVAVVAATIASVYAVVASERNRRQDARRAEVERVLQAALALVELAMQVGEISGTTSRFEFARTRLRAELQLTGVAGLESTELMTRPTMSAKEIVDQGEAAIIEIGRRLDELAPRPLLRWPFRVARD